MRISLSLIMGLLLGKRATPEAMALAEVPEAPAKRRKVREPESVPVPMELSQCSKRKRDEEFNAGPRPKSRDWDWKLYRADTKE